MEVALYYVHSGMVSEEVISDEEDKQTRFH